MKKTILNIGVFALIIGILLIALPFVYVPKNSSEVYQIAQSTVLVAGSVPQFAFSNEPTSKVTEGLPLNAGDSLNIQVNVTLGKDVDLSVNDGSTMYLSYSNVTTLNKDWAVPKSSDYNFVFNSLITFTSKDVTWQVTKNWTTPAYKDDTQNIQLLPFEVFYVGVVIVLAGITLAICGVVKREAPKTASPG